MSEQSLLSEVDHNKDRTNSTGRPTNQEIALQHIGIADNWITVTIEPPHDKTSKMV